MPRMPKTHLRIYKPRYKHMGQTDYEHEHNAACGYVRALVTRNMDNVDCFYCLRSKEMKYRRRGW